MQADKITMRTAGRPLAFRIHGARHRLGVVSSLVRLASPILCCNTMKRRHSLAHVRGKTDKQATYESKDRYQD